jgi:hypothetical protein
MTIFISVISIDGADLFNTIDDVYAKARHPSQLRFGILDGSETNQLAQLPSWREQINYIWIRPLAKPEGSYSRALLQGMRNSEKYVFNICPYMRFDRDWDEILISAMQRVPWKSILTSIPMRWSSKHKLESKDQSKEVIKIVPDQLDISRSLPEFASVNHDSGPLRGDRLCTDCLFSRGCLYDHVPHDHQIRSDHEDYTYSSRVRAAGWHIYYPLDMPIYLAKTVPAGHSRLSNHTGSSDSTSKELMRLPETMSRVDEVMKGCAGIYSSAIDATARLYADDIAFIQSSQSNLVDHNISEAIQDELKSLSFAIAPLLYGKHAPLKKGDNSTFVNRVCFGTSNYVLKSSTYDIHTESVINSLFFRDLVKTEGTYFSIAKPLLSVSMRNLHYILYPYVDHLSLGTIQYRRLLDYRFVLRAIGEFNAANGHEKSFLSIPRKTYRLFLNESRLKRRFPEQDCDVLDSLLVRAKIAHSHLSAICSEMNMKSYSFSHNDLHRRNIGIMKSPEVRRDSRVILMDFSRACWAPLGNDLFFFIFYLIMAKASAQSWLDTIEEYCNGLQIAAGSIPIESKIIAASAIIGYANAWLNIHKRPESSFDWYLFNICIDFCERYVAQGWPEVLDDLSSIYNAHESKRPS